MRVEVFGSDNCIHCKEFKIKLDNNNIEYDYYDANEFIDEISDCPYTSLPIVRVDGDYYSPLEFELEFLNK